MTTPPKKPRWRRWLVRLLLTTVVVRLLLALFLPQLLAFVASFAGVALSMRSASLSLLGLSFHAEDVVMRDTAHPEAPPLLMAQDLVVDVSSWQLLHGELGVVDVALSGSRIYVQRGADGQLQLPAAWTSSPAVAMPEPAAPAATTPMRFDLPAQIASLRMHDLQVHFADATTTPPRTLQGTLDLDATDLGHRDHAGTVTVRVHSTDFCDGAWFSLRLESLAERLDATWSLDVRGVRTESFALPDDALAALGRARALTLSLQGEVHATVDAARPRQPDVRGATTLTVLGDGLETLRTTTSFGPSIADGDGIAVPFSFDLAATELARVQVVDGSVHSTAGGLALHGALRAEPVTLTRLAPLLQRAGVTLPKAGIALQARFDVDLGEALTADLRDVQFGADDDRIALARASLRDLRSDDEGLAIGGIELQGPSLRIERTATGALRLAGIEFATPAPTAPLTPASAPATAQTLAPSLPQLRLGALQWNGLRVRCIDGSLTPPAELLLDEVALHADALTIGHDAPPGRITLRARLADAIESIGLEATLTPTASSLGVELALDVAGITATRLRPWLQPLGMEPELRAGRLTGNAAATVTTALDELGVRCTLANLRYRDGDDVLLQLRSLQGDALRMGPAITSLGAWKLSEPFLAVAREGDGTLRTLGLRINPPPADTTAAPASATPPTPATTTAAALPRGSVQIERAVLQFRDGAQAPLALGLDATLDAHDAGNGIPFDLVLRLDEAMRQARLQGKLTPASQTVAAELTIDGIRGAGLTRFLPPNVECTLSDGALRLQLAATGAPAGGSGGVLDVTQVQLTDRGEELATLPRLLLGITVLEPERIHISNLVGMLDQARVARTADGLHVPGFLLRPVAAAAPEAQAAPVAPATAATAAATPSPLRLPLLSWDNLQLSCERLVVRDRSAGDGEPLVVKAQLLGGAWQPDLASGKPLPATLQLTASALPLCSTFTAAVHVDPYALSPTLDAELDAKGLDLTALQRVLPSLSQHVQGTATDAVFTAKLHASLDLKRRDPRALDCSRAFAAEFSLHEVDFRAAAAERPFAHLDAVDLVARTIDPRTGDVLLRSIDIDAPSIDITKTAAGIECLGLRFPPAPQNGSATATPVPTPTKAPPAAAAVEPEFAVDRLQLQGFAVTFRDTTTDPVTVLPIADVEVELQRVSNRALTQARPIPFSVAVRSGDVELPKRVLKSSVLAGFLSSATKAIAGADDVHTMETRPLLDELRIEGLVQLAPELTGQVRTMLSAFELPALRGLAKQGGVDIADGLLDHRSTIELRGSQGVDVRSSSVFTWLSLSEPPGGPISTYLRLPAPLDTVLFLLRNDADEQRIPVDLKLPAKGLSGGSALDAAANALVAVLADAVKSAAGRATNLVTGVLGLGKDPTAQVGTAAEFAAGEVAPLSCAMQCVLDAVDGEAEKTIVLTHELGAGDLVAASALVDPAPELVQATVAGLRAARANLLAQREPLATELAAHYDAGRIREARTLQQRLADLDQELGALEQTLDTALQQLEPDARRRQQRGKAAAIELGQARLRALAAQLRAARPKLPANAIELRSVRAVPVQGLPEGGRVRLSVKRRTAQ